MKNRKFMAIGALAALTLGLIPVAASAQDRDSDCGQATADIVRQAVRAQLRQAVVAANAQVLAEITNSVSRAVTAEVTARVSARVQAALAQSISLQGRAEALAQQAPTPAPQVVINGEELSPLDETGWLGVTPEDVSADRAKELKLASPRGVYLSEVEKDSPAEKAGLKSGDVIVEFNGEKVESVAQFRRLVRETPPGRTVSIAVWRDGRSQTLSVTLGNYEDQVQGQLSGPLRQFALNPRLNVPDRELTVPFPPEARSFNFQIPEGAWNFNGNGNFFTMTLTPTLGISAESLSGQLGTYFGAPDGEGVLIREVNSDSPAEKAGLKAGDVIIKIDGERVKTVSEMQAKLRTKREAKTVQVSVVRRGAETTVTVEPNKPETRRATPRPASRPVTL